jgi:hypothetical protein
MTTTQQEQVSPRESRKIPDENAENIGIDGILAMQRSLPNIEASEFGYLAEKVNNVAWSALITLDIEYKEALVNPKASRQLLQAAYDKFYSTVSITKSHGASLSETELEQIGFEFLEFAVENRTGTSPSVRCAAADIGISFGVDNERINHKRYLDIREKHAAAYIKSNKKSTDEEQKFRLVLTEGILTALGGQIKYEPTSSYADSVMQYAKTHSKSTATAIVSTAMAGTVLLAPTFSAAATEYSSSVSVENNAPTPTIQLPEKNTNNGNKAVKLVTILEENAEKSPPVAKKIPIVIDLSVPEKKSAEEAVDVEAKKSPPKANKVPVVIDLTVPEKTPVKEEAAVDTEKKDTEPTVEPKVVVDLKQNEPVAAPEVAPAPTPEASAEPEAESLTSEQKEIKKNIDEIIATIHEDGDINMAASLIRIKFRDKGVDSIKNETSSKSKPVNADLISVVIDLELAVENTVNGKGHIDPNYSNTAYMTLAVLEAIASDPTVWQSEDIKKLVAGAKAPEDPYQLKLFNEYLEQAKAALDAPEVDVDGKPIENAGSKLLKGIDAEIHDSIKIMYAYSLLAAVSDTDQKAKIDGYIAEEAAKAAAETAKGQEQTGNQQSAEAEAFKNLIDREQDTATKHGLMYMNLFMNKIGLGAIPSAAIVANGWGESGMIDLCKGQNGGGPAKYTFQWEGERRVNFEKFAASQNKTCEDPEVQADFVNSELGRNHTKDAMNKATTLFEATKEFMVRWETPRKVIDAQKSGNWTLADKEAQRRTDLGQKVFDMFNAELKSVNDARVAAEAARVAAEAAASAAETERQAKMGMTFEQAVAFTNIYATSPDSVKHIGNSATNCNGGALSNCVSLSVYFINKHTNFKGMEKGPKANNPGNGKDVAGRIVERNPGTQSGNTAKPYSIFSKLGGEFGHTGLVLGVDENKIAPDGTRGVAIIAEAFCTSQSHNGKVKEYSLAYMNSGAFTYAYTDGHIDVPLQ